MRNFRPSPPANYRISVSALLISTIFLIQPSLAENTTTTVSETQVQYNLDTLPAKARETMNRIMAAARSGDVDELRAALEWNELPPEIGADNKTDPITYWKKQSSNGSVHGIMAKMLEIFERGFTVHNEGDKNEQASYAWPYLAAKNLKTLKPHEDVDLLRLATPDEVKSMKATGKYSGYRAVIGADGTWHSFKKTQ